MHRENTADSLALTWEKGRAETRGSVEERMHSGSSFVFRKKTSSRSSYAEKIPGKRYRKFSQWLLHGECFRLGKRKGFYFLLYALLHCMDGFDCKTCITLIGELNSE